MCTLENESSLNEQKKAALDVSAGYLAASAGCFILFIIYNFFSHGVHSPYLTWLFAYPLVLGFLPCYISLFMKKLRTPNCSTRRLYRMGTAAMTVSSLLRGVLEIAGTSSQYQIILMYIGIAMLISGVVSYFYNPIS